MPAERVAERLGLDALLRRQRTADLLLHDPERELELQARELDRLAVPQAPRCRGDDERAPRRGREEGLGSLPFEPQVVDDDERPPIVQRPAQPAARGPHGRVATVVELLEERLEHVVERGIQRVHVDDPVRERAARRVVRDVREEVGLADARLAVDVHDPALLRGGEHGAGLARPVDVIRVAARPAVERNGEGDRIGDLTQPVQQRAVDALEPDLQVDVVAGDDDAVADVAADGDAPRARRSHQCPSVWTWSPVMIVEPETSRPDRDRALAGGGDDVRRLRLLPDLRQVGLELLVLLEQLAQLDTQRPERVLVLGVRGDLLDRLLGGGLLLDPRLQPFPELLGVVRRLVPDHVGGLARDFLAGLHHVRQERREEAGQSDDLHWRPPDASEAVFLCQAARFLTPRGQES